MVKDIEHILLAISSKSIDNCYFICLFIDGVIWVWGRFFAFSFFFYSLDISPLSAVYLPQVSPLCS